jgi:hypothetical protein
MKERSDKEPVAREFSIISVCNFAAAARHHRTMMESAGTISPGMLSRAEEELTALPIWAFTLGIFALLTFGLTAVPSIICGHLALARGRERAGSPLAKWVARAGLVIGYLGAILFGTWITVLARPLFQ